jgi:hypothetical protein
MREPGNVSFIGQLEVKRQLFTHGKVRTTTLWTPGGTRGKKEKVKRPGRKTMSLEPIKPQ